MVDTYPQPCGAGDRPVWTGLRSYARTRMPQIGKLDSGLWHCTAFGGHGMNSTALRPVVAEGILGETTATANLRRSLDWTGGSPEWRRCN